MQFFDPPPDNRAAQAARVADFLKTRPYSTPEEIEAACSTGCIADVLASMKRPELPGMGYGLAYGWRGVLCADGSGKRYVRTYALLHRPKTRQTPALCKPA